MDGNNLAMLNGLVTIADHAFGMETTRPMHPFDAVTAREADDGARPAGLRSTLRRAVLLIGLAATASAATHAFLAAVPTDTEVRARLVVERRGTAGVADATFLDAQAKLISSRDSLRRAASELGVAGIDALARPSLWGRALAVAGIGGGKLVSPEERLTDALSARFSAAPSGRGRAIDLSFLAGDGDFAVRFVDRVAADYLALQGTDGGATARLVSGAVAVEVPARLSPEAGAGLAALSVLLLGGVGAAFGRWRRRAETGEPLDEAPLTVIDLAPRDPVAEGDAVESTDRVCPPDEVVAPPASVSGIDLCGRRRVAVASFGEGGDNRRLVDEMAREGGFNGARIVVVDASRRTGDRPGLAELLSGEADFADVIQRNAASRAHEIGAGRRPLAALADDTEAAALLVETLEQTYDLVLIDLGTLRADPAFALFARLSGQLMLTGDADRGAVDTLLAALGRRGVTDIVRVPAPAGDIAA